MRTLVAYASSLIVFLALDIGWITLVVSPLYKSQLGAMVLDKPSLPPAVLFYLLFLAGLVYFAVLPGLRDQSGWTALLDGALFGFFSYVTYALTNLSILRGWTVLLAVSDIGWGIVVAALTALGSFFITSRLTR